MYNAYWGVINVDSTTLKESVSQITPEFTYKANIDNLHSYPEQSFPWHWHNELEFFYVRSGQLDYHLPGGTYTFCEGEGGFVNANILHMTKCENNYPCLLEEHLFLPEFIGGHESSIFMKKYILPVTTNSSLELYRFDPSKERDRKIVPLLREAFDLYYSDELFREFDIREILTQIWRLIYEDISEIEFPHQSGNTNERIKKMMAFIAANYNKKITLEQIAESGFISVRECCRCFQDNLGQTPFSYLTDYRLRCSCDLLRNTELPITTISTSCGFGSTSYFGKVFRERFLCTPKDYRTKNRNPSA